MRYDVEVNGRRRQVNVHRANGRFVVDVDEKTWTVDASRVSDQMLSLIITDRPDRVAGGLSHEVTLAPDAATGALTAAVSGVPMSVVLNGRRRGASAEAGVGKSGPQRLLAPMPGKVVKVLVKVGDRVKARQPVVIIEAMKMENELRSSRDGRVAELIARDGQSVDAGVLLVVIADG